MLFDDEFMRKRKRTYYQLSKETGIGEGELWRFKKGERVPSLALARKIVHALGISLNNFFFPGERLKSSYRLNKGREIKNE